MDERRLGYMDGREDGWEEGHTEGRAEGHAEGLKDAITALKGIVDPAVIADRFKISL